MAAKNMSHSQIVDGVQEIILDSWEDFFPLTIERFNKTSNCIYRGQANYNWDLNSTLDRHRARYRYRKKLAGSVPEEFNSPPLSEEQHLSAFKYYLLGRRGPNPPTLTEDEVWALGQHHGLATPLLDWTFRPWVALFFAFDQDAIVIDGKHAQPEFRGVYMANSSLFAPDRDGMPPEVRIISSEADSNPRLVSQAALFLKLPKGTDLESYVHKVRVGENGPRPALTKFKIPNRDRDGCLVALKAMNISYATLFPDIDGAARHVNSLWQPGHEELISYIPSVYQYRREELGKD